MRRLVVGDVHGCADKLQAVLADAWYSPAWDRLFLLGDYIDRGPHPDLAVEIVHSLAARGAVALRGNHEQMALDGAAGDPAALARWLSQGGTTTLACYRDCRLPDAVLRWFASLPLFWEEPDCIFVHAGLRPGVPIAQQVPRDLLWIRDAFYLRYRGKRVIFGHTPTTRLHGKHAIWRVPYMTGIDTGACSGGVLTLLDIDTYRTWTA